MNSIVAGAIADFFVAICAAAVIGVVAYIFRERIFDYMKEAKMMKSVGVTALRKNSYFSSSGLRRIFNKASVVRIYYKTGKRFWDRLDKEDILKQASIKNPNLIVKVLLANANSKQSKSMYMAERRFGTRIDSEDTIIKEIDEVNKVLDKFDFIECRTDPDLFFLPYMVVEYKKNNKKKEVCYLGLTIIPVRSPNALQIVSEKTVKAPSDIDESAIERFDKKSINEATLVEQLSIHFDTAWEMAEQYIILKD